jgi:redox-sensing transcriptional repressor
MNNQIPKPAIRRLCILYDLLTDLENEGMTYITSGALGQRLLTGSHTIRKDINYIGELGPSPAGYAIKELKALLSRKLGLAKEHKACLVGLDQLGQFLLGFSEQFKATYPLLPGFDINTNRLEIIKTSLPLYPAYQIEEVLKRKQIEIALITIQSGALPDIITRLIKGGIKGIINFSSTLLPEFYPNVWVKNLNILGELRNLSALLELMPSLKGEKSCKEY